MEKMTSYSFLLFMLTACSAQERRLFMFDGGERVPGPNGKEAYLVSCYDISRCYDKAERECHGYYDIESVTQGISDGGLLVQNMLVTCESYSIYKDESFF